MLVLVSFVLVLAAAVTLVVGLLQSGLTLIYLSIACSVLAGVVLAIAVLRGRPEPSVAAAPRAYTPPPPREPVPASVGAPSAQPTTSWSAPTTEMPASPSPSSTPPPPPPPSPAPGPSDDAATKAAGTALLGRLRSRRGQQDQEDAGVAAAPVATSAPEPAAAPEPEPVPSDMTMEMPVVSAGREADDGFPIADYDRLRATELLSRLPELDRNQLEAVRDREMAGKNRFTILSRVDALLAAQEGPAWEVADDEWEAEEAEADTGGEPIVLDAEPLEIDEFETVGEEAEEWEAVGSIEDDEVDELVSRADEFPIAGYESLTVGQILPRLSELDADQLAQVRAREVQGRARGTILDRVDRLAAKSGTGAGAMAMPPAAAPPRARRAPAKATDALKADAPAAKKRARKAAPVPAADVTPIPAPPATPARAPRKTVAKATKAEATKAKAAPAKRAMPAAKATPTARKAPGRAKKAAPVIPAETAAPVKKARKSTKKL